jgi:RNA polymerase sigma factor (sigma-70 family)
VPSLAAQAPPPSLGALNPWPNLPSRPAERDELRRNLSDAPATGITVRALALTTAGAAAGSPPGADPWDERALYERLASYVHGLVRRVLGSDSREQDLVQEVLCLVLRHRHQLRDHGQWGPWVRAIALNVIYSELRQRRQRRAASQDLGTDLTANLEHAVVARDLLSRLRSSIDRLPAGERAAFFLRFIEQRTVAEIASLEGYSLATAQRRLRRPRRILRSFLAENPGLTRRLRSPAGHASRIDGPQQAVSDEQVREDPLR